MATSVPTPETARARLTRVNDPELDESIVELDYIRDLTIDGSAVTVTLVLPTAWCSPAFAWMMATDARDELEHLPGVTDATIRLEDHMHEAEINHGVNDRLAFEAVFADATEGIEDVRQTLDEKARLNRQYRAIKALLDAGLNPDQVVELTDGDLDDAAEATPEADRIAIYLADGAFGVSVPAEPIVEYLEKARAVGVVTHPSDRAFTTLDGDPIPADELERVQHDTRLTGANVSGQAMICEGLNSARNG